MHLHIDGGGDEGWVLAVVKELEQMGAVGKLTEIAGTVPGPLRDELQTTYESHTPGTGSSEVGGWFNFARGNSWSYRSNSFWTGENLRDRILAECAAMDAYVKTHQAGCRRWTIVEQVLGIWRSPALTTV